MLALLSSAALLSLGLVQSVQAHLVLSNFYINDVTPGDGVCLRFNSDPNRRNYPVEDLSSDAMVCGFDGTKGKSRICPADAGDKLTFGWETFREERPQNGYLDPQHKGPCSVMMKKVNSASQDSGVGDGWFSIFYEGYNKDSGKWCTERVVEGGKISVEIPKDLAAGDYLIRSELLALHAAAAKDRPNPQFYISCAQIFLKSTGNATPRETVNIPSGYVNMQMPAMTYNIWWGPEHDAKYPDYGPPLYRSTGQTSGKGNQVQTQGLKPDGCVLEDTDWCGIEVPKYSDQKGCWDSVKACWDQNQSCWKQSIGYTGCDAWSKKCEAIGKNCENQVWTGPPNHGQEVKHAGSSRRATCPNVIHGGSSSSGMNYERDEDSAGEQAASSSSSTEEQKPTESASETKVESTTSASEVKAESTSSAEQKPTEESSSSSSQLEQKSEDVASIPTEVSTVQVSPATETPKTSAAPANKCIATVTDVVYETVTTTVMAEKSAAAADLHRHKMRARHLH